MKCGDCKHWHPQADHWDLDAPGMGCCWAINPWWEVASSGSDKCKEYGSEYWHKLRKNALAESLAVVGDGSEYAAALYTMPEFFCANFEEENDQKT